MVEINVQRMLAVAGAVNIDPSKYNQRVWTCGTARCFGGWAVHLFSGMPTVEGLNGFYVKEDTPGATAWTHTPHRGIVNVLRKGEIISVFTDKSLAWDSDPLYEEGEDKYLALDVHKLARHLLGLTEDEAQALFNAYNTLEEVNAMVLAMINGTAYKCGVDCPCSLCVKADEEDEYGHDCYLEGCYDGDEYDSDAAYEDRY